MLKQQLRREEVVGKVLNIEILQLIKQDQALTRHLSSISEDASLLSHGSILSKSSAALSDVPVAATAVAVAATQSRRCQCLLVS